MKRLLALAFLVSACSEGANDGSPAAESPDTSVALDVAPVEPDTTPAPDEGPPPPPPFHPVGNVYEANPLDTPETIVVELPHLTSDDHRLEGEFARVRNCVPDTEGQQVDVGFMKVTVCTPSFTALPGDDGTYQHIAPPADPGSMDDQFAEVNMYFHMQLIHDYFKDNHGLTELDWPLDAIVNLQAYVGLCDTWSSIGNAAFVPKGANAFFGIDLPLDVAGDALIFGQTKKKDFSYEADVVYHEYTHAMVGSTRLNAVFPDDQGINNLPGALNEAYADYFAGSLSEDSTIGDYALTDTEPIEICGVPLGTGGANLARDMSNLRTCPDDLTGEVHADSELFSSALWVIRKDLGPEVADKIILGALLGFTQTTDFGTAAAATVAFADEELPTAKVKMVKAAFEARNLLDCKRALPIAKIGARGLPLTVMSEGSFDPNPYGNFVPGPMQLQVELPPEVKEATIYFTVVGGQPKGEIAWKPGPEPVAYTYNMVTGKSTNDSLVATPLEKGSGSGVWKTRIAGSCLSKGVWTFAIHNKGGELSIAKVTATPGFSEPTDPNFGGCGQ